MDTRRRTIVAAAATAVLFLLVQLGALALVGPFVAAGYQTVEDPSDPTNTFAYFVAILVATGAILAILRLGANRLLRALVAAMSGMLSLYVFSVLVPPVVAVDGLNAVAWGLAALVAVAIYAYPEWYVIDAAGIVMGAGGAGLFGISFGPLPAVLLLSVLAVYDALSVYRTRHMLTLAAGVTDLKLPLVLVIPLTWSYSFRADTPVDVGTAAQPDGQSGTAGVEAAGDTTALEGTGGERGRERDAFFVGLGDAVLPTVLVASAAVFLETPPIGPSGIALTVPALGAMIGTLVGLGILLSFVAKGRPHAGLPLLNGGAILGYLLGALASGVGPATALGLAPYL